MSIHPSWVAYAKWLENYQAGHTAVAEDSKDHEMIYLAAPYSKIENKEKLMTGIMTFSGHWQATHLDQHICSPLFNHFSLNHVPTLGADYEFWLNYSRNMLKRCDRLVVICLSGWQDSTGVADEVDQATKLGIPITYVSKELFTAVTGITLEVPTPTQAVPTQAN